MEPHAEPFLTRYYEMGRDHLLRPQCICNYMEEAAGIHAAKLGVGFDRMNADGLAWVLAKGAFAIPGTKRLGYLEQNVAAASLRLSADDVAKLDSSYAPGTFSGERYTAEGMKGVNA